MESDRHPGEASTCEYHADIASGFTSIKGDLRWFGSIGKWILGTTCTILGFMVLQGLLFLSDMGRLSSKVDMLVMRADKVTEINKAQNDKIEILMQKLILHDEQIKSLRDDMNYIKNRRNEG